ncbi:uncharacterized protein LOC119464789 isoform X1 [Dermacentor silvarum]|uniref:uncharacterized protein LOC119464789 isoform X1 n=1 Tax=Dermacentor silvarum TaxID=543639 RepID=UPI002101209A|nr:uncharacterized protein LOC119464789 isoform X1 [Dermacentor silvarum]XP_049511860.1 uncharacterized protein LOC119464789 isoform X1 [Dermacentor silvarum]XP_049511861.1 uncharacterized protein LOC119464789 isoform X1 [Dermacentor silvarum]
MFRMNIFARMKKMLEYMIFIAVFISGNQCFSNNAHAQSYDCRVILSTSLPKTTCYYACTDGGNRLRRGMHTDGTPCLHPRTGKIGQCMRGVCILKQDEGPYFNSTADNDRCDGQYHGKGYAPRCQYTCNHHGRRKQMHYHAGTPCIRLDEEGEPVGNAGICWQGVCTPYDKLEARHPNIKKKVFPRMYHKCQDKDHFGRNNLWDCYYYCLQRNEWFYGYYKSDYNSRCERVGPQRKSGYCCKGECIPKANCGQDVEDTAGSFGWQR